MANWSSFIFEFNERFDEDNFKKLLFLTKLYEFNNNHAIDDYLLNGDQCYGSGRWSFLFDEFDSFLKQFSLKYDIIFLEYEEGMDYIYAGRIKDDSEVQIYYDLNMDTFKEIFRTECTDIDECSINELLYLTKEKYL